MQSLWKIEQSAAQFLSCKYIGDLSQLLEVPKKNLSLHGLSPEYFIFTVPKKDGSKRLIEAPYPALKKILRKINYYLQCIYFLQKPSASYGYIINYKGNSKPCNILTNAEQHLNAKYLVNIDFEDFFHQVDISEVYAVFNSAPFHFTKKCSELLSKLCCFNDRLTIGSPTSPVLSNFNTQALDEDLTKWASSYDITYTRFVDDLSFSSQTPVDKELLTQIHTFCDKHNFRINPDKTKQFEPVDTKIVTGLQVSDKVTIPEKFYYELSQDIRRLEQTVETSVIIKGKKQSGFVKEFEQQVTGKINFIGMVLGKGSEKYKKYITEYEKAMTPNLEQLSTRWIDFPYSFD